MAEQKTVSLREAALTAEETTNTKNISELEEVNLDDCKKLEKRDFTRKDGTPFSIEVVCLDGVDYRVPQSVKLGLQQCLIAKPDMKKFRVMRSGTTKDDTKYTVVPL